MYQLATPISLGFRSGMSKKTLTLTTSTQGSMGWSDPHQPSGHPTRPPHSQRSPPTVAAASPPPGNRRLWLGSGACPGPGGHAGAAPRRGPCAGAEPGRGPGPGPDLGLVVIPVEGGRVGGGSGGGLFNKWQDRRKTPPSVGIPPGSGGGGVMN